MSVVLVFGRDDPARVRFAVSPLWETMAAVRVLLEPQRRAYHLPWLDAVRPDLDRLDLWPLLVLSSPQPRWTGRTRSLSIVGCRGRFARYRIGNSADVGAAPAD